MQPKDAERLAMRVSANTMLGNVLLSAAKLAAGLLGHSTAMVSDAAHSLSDVLSTIVVMIGVKLSGKEADETHPYGHERLECVAAMLLAVILFATGLLVGAAGLRSLLGGAQRENAAPGWIALAAAVLSILVKEGMYWYTRRAAKRITSAALMADAWHHRSDAFSSVGSLIGIAGARLGVPEMDGIASIVISLFILLAALRIFRDATAQLTDRACDAETRERICALTLQQEGVAGIDLLRTRQFGSRIYAEMEISADGNISLCDGHSISHRVHDSIEQQLPRVKHCTVHVNPAGPEL